MSDYLQKIIYLTQGDYDTLAQGTTEAPRTITKNGVTLTNIDNNYIYMTDGKVSMSDLDDSLIIPVSKGGTGNTSWAAGKILVGNGSNTFTTIDKATTNTANTLVQRDSTGSFNAQDITLAGILTAGTLDGDQHIINGNVQLNAKSGSYNEGLRINRSTTGYANIYLGAARNSASSNQTGGWWIGTLSTPANATATGSTITNTVFTISQDSTDDGFSIKGTRGATRVTNSGWAIKPRLAVGTTYQTGYNFYVNGNTQFDIGTNDTTSHKRFKILGNGRFISLGGSGIMAYNTSNGTDSNGTLNIQYYGGNVNFGFSSSTVTTTIYGSLTLPTNSTAFNFSGMGAASDNVARNIWFSYNGQRGTPVYDDDFKYNPSTNTLSIGTGTLTATNYSGNAATATTAGNVTGTVAVNHGGTGETTKLAAGLIYNWTAVVQGQTWSRLCYVPASTTNTGSSILLNFRGTRSSVIYNFTLLIHTHHENGQCHINVLQGNGYSGTKIRGVTDTNGNVYIELYDDANSIAATTTQNITCNMLILTKGSTEPTLYTVFTNGATLPSGYTAHELTVVNSGGFQTTGNNYATSFVVDGTTTSLSNNNLTFAQGGGWYMNDTTWIRTVGSKSIYVNSGTLRVDGDIKVKTLNHVNGSIVNDGSWITGANGTAGDGTNAGTLGTSILSIGNATAQSKTSGAGANNAQGYLRLFSSGTGYAQVTAYSGDKVRFYPEEGISLPRDKIGIMFRPDSASYYTYTSYQTNGNEALVFATQNAVTSFIFVNGESYANVASNRWRSLTGASGAGNAPGIQIKQNCVSIGKLIDSDTNASYKLQVYGGQTYLNSSASSTSNLSGQLIVANEASTNVALELWRNANGSWQIANEGGNLYFRSNLKNSAKQTTYSETMMTIAYNTGNTTFTGSVTAAGGFSGNATSATTATNLASAPTLSAAGTATIDLSANTTYTLTVGGKSVVFKTPTNNNNYVTQSSSTTGNWHKILLHYKDDTSPTAAITYSTNIVYSAVGVSVQPSTGTIRAGGYNIIDKVRLEYNSTDDSLDFVFI